MPVRGEPHWTRDAGLTLIEVMIVVALSSLLALAVLPMATRSASRQVATAERAISLSESLRAGREFRTILETVRAETVSGTPFETRARLLAPASAACGGGAQITLQILRVPDGGSLVCGDHTIWRWRAGAAVLRYSGDGEIWSETWAPPTSLDAGSLRAAPAPLVRFEWRAGPVQTLSWLARAGDVRQPGIDPEASPQEPAQQ